MRTARGSAKKIETLVEKAAERKLHTGSRNISKLGKLMGKIG